MSFKTGELLGKMIAIAASAHAGQTDRGGKPYLLHPLQVMFNLNSDDEELQCIAVLHDVVEDCGITYQYLLEQGATERIINGVRCLTKISGETYDEYKSKVKSNIDSVKVKKEDLRHNSDLRRLKGVRDKDIERMAKYTQFYYELCRHEEQYEAQGQ